MKKGNSKALRELYSTQNSIVFDGVQSVLDEYNELLDLRSKDQSMSAEDLDRMSDLEETMFLTVIRTVKFGKTWRSTRDRQHTAVKGKIRVRRHQNADCVRIGCRQ